MADQFLTFKRFHEEETAKDLIQKLKELHIEFEVEDTEGFFDPSFAKNGTNRDISIKLKPADFMVAQKELESYYRFLTEQVDNNYYLFEFSDEELKEIIEKPDEWGDFDYQLAQKILTGRGNKISPDQIAELQKKRNDELAIPEPYHTGWIYFGYFSAIAGGVFGIIVGSHLYYSKKTLPDGRRVYFYREWERKHGKRILILGSIFFPIWFIIKLKYPVQNI